MAYRRKQVYARVSDTSGKFLSAWYNIQMQGFTKTLNGGCGECVFKLAVPFDYDSSDLALGNDVQVTIADATTTNNSKPNTDGSGARVVFRGYISLIERDSDDRTEEVTVHVLGYYTRLDLDILKNGSQTTLYSESSAGLTTVSGSNSAADTGLMARAIIDRFNTENTPGLLFYNGTVDVPNSGTTAKFAFKQKTYREALDLCKDLAPANTYWYINELGQLTFQTLPTSPTWVFVMGRDFAKVHVEHSLEKVRNGVLVYDGTSGGSYKHYQNAGSVALYGRRIQRETRFGIQSDGTASDALATKFLAENANPGLKLVMTIFDDNNTQSRGVDIESIQPGQTCRVVGYSSNLSDIFPDNMIITGVTYSLDKVEVTAEIVKSDIFERAARSATEVQSINSGGFGIPDSYS